MSWHGNLINIHHQRAWIQLAETILEADAGKLNARSCLAPLKRKSYAPFFDSSWWKTFSSPPFPSPSTSMQLSCMIYEHHRKADYLSEWMHRHQESMMYEMNFSNAMKKKPAEGGRAGEAKLNFLFRWVWWKFLLFCGLICYSAEREEKKKFRFFSRHWSRQTLPSNYHASLGSLTQIQLKLFDHFINYDSSPYLTNGLNIKLPASGGNYFVDSMSVGVFCNSSGKKVFHFLKCLLLCFWF